MPYQFKFEVSYYLFQVSYNCFLYYQLFVKKLLRNVKHFYCYSLCKTLFFWGGGGGGGGPFKKKSLLGKVAVTETEDIFSDYRDFHGKHGKARESRYPHAITSLHRFDCY